MLVHLRIPEVPLAEHHPGGRSGPGGHAFLGGYPELDVAKARDRCVGVGVGTGFLKSTHSSNWRHRALDVHFLRGLHVDLRNRIGPQVPVLVMNTALGPFTWYFPFAITRSPLRSIKMYTANGLLGRQHENDTEEHRPSSL